MNKNNLIIFGLVIVIVALLAGIGVSMMTPAKVDVKLTIVSNETINEDDNVDIKLTDINDTPISNETVNITITDENGTSDYHSVVTNYEGVGSLKMDKEKGKYNITLKYGGNDKYNGGNITKKLTITGKVVEAEPSSSSSSQSKTYASGLTDSEIESYIQRDLDERAKNGVKGDYDYQGAREFYENVPPSGMI